MGGERVHVAQAHRLGEVGEPVEEGPGRRLRAQVEGDHAPEGAHLAGGDGVLRVAL